MSQALNAYMNSLDPCVRADLERMYENAGTSGGILTPDILENAEDRAHAEAVSDALQGLEQVVGDEGDFRWQSVIDYVQQEYDGEAAQLNDDFRSGDTDGRQNYDRDANVASAQRASKHRSSADTRWERDMNHWQASAFMQQNEAEALWWGREGAADRIDRIQERHEGRTGLRRRGYTADADGRGTSLGDWARQQQQAYQLFMWMQAWMGGM